MGDLRYAIIKGTTNHSSGRKVSIEQICNVTCYDNKKYRVGIPWRKDKTKLPDNYKMALQRLENTKKKLQRSPYLKTAYQQVIESYIQRGYVRKVPEHEQSNSKWFLPHFPVIRPDKDTTKIRIVLMLRTNFTVLHSMTPYTKGLNCNKICLIYCCVLEGSQWP